jgi:hypothetical protein
MLFLAFLLCELHGAFFLLFYVNIVSSIGDTGGHICGTSISLLGIATQRKRGVWCFIMKWEAHVYGRLLCLCLLCQHGVLESWVVVILKIGWLGVRMG